MECIVRFDCHADIIEIPTNIAVRIHEYRNQFLDWLYDKHNDHDYWVGNKEGVCYDTDAFVEWLNNNVKSGQTHPITIIEEGIAEDVCPAGMIEIFF